MANIYYEPEKFGLRTVGEVEWDDGAYQYDLTVVWQDTRTGHLFAASDSGCSCPSPFEWVGLNDATPLADWAAVNNHLLDRLAKQDYSGYADDRERVVGQIADIVQRLRNPQRESPDA